MCSDATLQRPVTSQFTVPFFLRNPCTSVYDVRSVRWVDLYHKIKRCLSSPQSAEVEIQKQRGKQAYTGYLEVSQVT